MNYSRNDVLQGNQYKQQLKETSNSFDNPEGIEKNNKRRMAGLGGARAQEMMNDPVAQQQANDWMSLFGLSNEGAQFEQAKIQKAAQGMI